HWLSLFYLLLPTLVSVTFAYRIGLPKPLQKLLHHTNDLKRLLHFLRLRYCQLLLNHNRLGSSSLHLLFHLSTLSTDATDQKNHPSLPYKPSRGHLLFVFSE